MHKIAKRDLMKIPIFATKILFKKIPSRIFILYILYVQYQKQPQFILKLKSNVIINIPINPNVF